MNIIYDHKQLNFSFYWRNIYELYCEKWWFKDKVMRSSTFVSLDFCGGVDGDHSTN